MSPDQEVSRRPGPSVSCWKCKTYSVYQFALNVPSLFQRVAEHLTEGGGRGLLYCSYDGRHLAEEHLYAGGPLSRHLLQPLYHTTCQLLAKQGRLDLLSSGC